MTHTFIYQIDEGRYLERFGLSFAQFEVGQIFVHRPGLTISQQDNSDATLDTYNGAMVHFDTHYAAAAAWDAPLVVSTLTVARLVGMGAKTFARRGAIPRFHEIALTAPVFGGDTLYAESRILASRAPEHTSPARDARGLVRVVTSGYRRRGDDQPVAIATLDYDIEIDVDESYQWAGRTLSPCRDARFAAYRREGERHIEQWGLFFEDVEEGEAFVHTPRRSFQRADIVAHARRAFDFAPQFHDDQWLVENQKTRLTVPETLLLGAVTAQTTRIFGRVVANLGWTDIALAPVFEGDSIEAESTIVAKRLSKSRPQEGILTVDTVARNQNQETICSFRRNLLIYKRAHADPYARAGY